ncbi:MAG: SUMF1/EgtB/PvdO family nonheme iron enzyme [Synechococcus sp.]
MSDSIEQSVVVKHFFVSYVEADRPWADWITWLLEDSGYIVTAAILGNSPGQSFVDEIGQAIAESDCSISIISKKSVGSDWLSFLVNRNVEWAKALFVFIRVDNVEFSPGLDKFPVIDLSDATESKAEQLIISALEAMLSDEQAPLETIRGTLQVGASPATVSFSGKVSKQIRVYESDLGRILAVNRHEQVRLFRERLGEELVLEMMQVLGGHYSMGSPEGELERLSYEGPQHDVMVPEFFIGKYPVTQEQWKFVAELPKVDIDLKANPSNFPGEKRPVEQVSWFEAVEFCDRLSRYTERTYRLPSEAEWEYTCRAGTRAPFNFGETISTDFANYDGSDDKSGTYAGGPKGEYRAETTPVDLFDCANAFGLCDMHGNVSEWCLDHWHNSYEGAPEDGSAWIDKGAKKNNPRIRRGGSWASSPRNCRSAYRDDLNPRASFNSIGFRVVCEEPRALQ